MFYYEYSIILARSSIIWKIIFNISILVILLLFWLFSQKDPNHFKRHITVNNFNKNHSTEASRKIMVRQKSVKICIPHIYIPTKLLTGWHTCLPTYQFTYQLPLFTYPANHLSAYHSTVLPMCPASNQSISYLALFT